MVYFEYFILNKYLNNDVLFVGIYKGKGEF